MQARLLNVRGEILDDIYDVDYTKIDRKNNPLLTIHNQLNGDQKKVRAHPSRILPIDKDGSMVFWDQVGSNKLIASCPACGSPCVVDIKNARATTCNDHGEFKLSWLEIKQGRIFAEVTEKVVKKQTLKRRKPIVVEIPDAAIPIDFEKLKAIGELWSKKGNFDYPTYELLSHVIVITTNGVSRKHCFNSYNRTWGNKVKLHAAKDHELMSFVANKPMENGKTVGTVIDNLEKFRNKLIKSGYVVE